ncbi:MAG: hypothetical protein JW910_15645 [Anaerolineae bacterium]|nr:hypothetical protein [Anaerolineae bacterium]
MTHYPDLSLYEYAAHEPGTVTIGWLEAGHAFPTGPTPPEFRARLRAFYTHPVHVMRGFQPCGWCGFGGMGDDLPQGSGEIRVVGPEYIYAAPTMLLHYVEAHDYLPPQEFIDAVQHGPLPDTHEWITARARVLWQQPEIVRAQVAGQMFRYPALTVRDAYKLLYQGVRGPAHLITDADAFLARLHAEIDGLAAVEPVEEPWEVIQPDGALVRVNLRPYVKAGHSVARLAQACIETAAFTWGTPDLLRAAWGVFVALCAEGRLAFPPDEVAAFTAWLDEHGYPAAHHSEVYRAAYSPAYRVVGMAAIWRELGLHVDDRAASRPPWWVA